MNPTVIFLIGPTGSGKSKLGLALAKLINGEIISCDSMQIYRDMDIGTDKPSRAARVEIPHHLVDCVSPDEEFSTYQHREWALKEIELIFERGCVPLVVGGSGLYFKAIVDGLAAHPGKDEGVRERLASECERFGVASLYDRLVRVDSVRAEDIHPNDVKRIIRALEIWECSGKKPSDWVSDTKGFSEMGWGSMVFGLRRDRKELYARIDKRVDHMISEGWLEEVRQLRKWELSTTASEAIGYSQLSQVLDAKVSFEGAVSEVKKETRNYAKRQMTWFRNDKRVQWIDVEGDDFLTEGLQQIENILRRSGIETCQTDPSRF